MNELIQALGQYTEALETKITSLTQQLAEQAKLIEELRLKNNETDYLSTITSYIYQLQRDA